MAVATTVTAKYVADTNSYVQNLSRATDATREFSRAIPEAAASTKQLSSSAVGLSAAFGTVATLVGAKAVGAIQRYARQGIEAAKQYEQTVISIQGIFAGTGMSMEDAAAKTERYLGELRDFAARTPFELPQTLDAVKRLLSIGYAADDVKNRMLPAIGDIVAALGQPPSAISGVVYAFGQMKSAGRVLTQDLMQIGNALPGFNAKMAIANEMFGGDMRAMTEAMEKGSVDSSKAIDVLITAMTKFGGAAGAMDRQSKTLQGVISTFNDTVNNALIDGLLPSLPVLSSTLQDVMPAVESLATAFAQQLGPALIGGAGAIGQLAPIATDILPPLMQLVGGATSLTQALVALGPAISVVAKLLGAFAALLDNMPDIVMGGVAALLLLTKVGTRFGLSMQGANAKATSGILGFHAAVRGTAAGSVTGFGAIGASAVTSMGATARAANGALVAMQALGRGFKTLLASIGPVGFAIIGVTAIMEVFSNRSAAADQAVADLKTTIDETNGSLTEMSALMIAAKLRESFTPEQIADLESMGISFADMTKAIMEGGPAADEMARKLDAIALSAGGVNSYLNPLAGLVAPFDDSEVDQVNRLRTAFDDLNGAAQQTRVDAANAAAAQEQVAGKTQEVENNLVTSAKNMANQHRMAYAGMSENAQRHADFISAKQSALTKAYNAGVEAVKALDEATKNMLATISGEASYDNARKSINDLNKTLADGTGKIKGYSDEALKNRAAIRDAAQSYIDYANSLTDPIERQKALEEGQKRIAQALRKAGIDPKDSDIIKTMQAQAEQSGKTVDEFAAQRRVAADYGNQVGKNFIDGIIAQLAEGKNLVEKGAYDVGAAMPAGADAGTDSASPSKKGRQNAKNFIDGIVLGLKDGMSNIDATASGAGKAMISALKTSIAGGGGISDVLNDIYGTLPTKQPRIVEQLGEEGAKKWIEKNKDDLQALGEWATAADAVLGRVRQSAAAFEGIGDAVEQPLGEASQIMEAFGRGGSRSSVVSMYQQLDRLIKDIYEPLTNVDEMGAAAAAEAKRSMDQARADLKKAAQEVMDLMRQRDETLAQMDRVRQATDAKIKGINEKYDALDKAAAAAIANIEAKYNVLIPQLQKKLDDANKAFETENQILQKLISERDSYLQRVSEGFRSFLNNLTDDTEGGSFREAMAARLQSIRDFASNVKALAARGLDTNLLQEIVAGGPDRGGSIAAGLMASSQDDIMAINQMQADLAAETESFTEFANQQWFAYGISQQEAIVAPLKLAAEQAKAALELANQNRAAELAAAQAHAAGLRELRQQEIAQAEADRDAELERLQGVVDALEVQMDQKAKDIQTYFTNLQKTFPPQMITLGEMAIQGLIQGMANREGSAYAKAQAIANQIRNIISSAFAVMSPSRVMMHIGEMISLGLAVGMEKGMSDVESAANALAGAANPSFGAGTFTTGAASGGASAVMIGEGAVQVNVSGSLDGMSAAEIQAIVEDALLGLAREIRRT